MKILGLNYLSESSISYMENGKIKFSISEERLNRIKNWYGNPLSSIEHFLNAYNLDLKDINYFCSHGLVTNFKEEDLNFREYKKKLI